MINYLASISELLVAPQSPTASFKVLLEALAVDDGWTRFVIFLLADPHLLEGGQRSQDGATDPDRVFTLWWGDDLDFHRWGREGCDFLLHTVSNTWVHTGTTRKNGVGVQVLTDINVALHDAVIGGLVDA